MHAQFYLKSLLIQNFATFKNQTIRFRPGFNVIVGETGSGKSLVLDALQLILGSRADRKAVRRDTDHCLLEATFHCEDEKVKTFLAEEGYPISGNELIIKRMIQRNGTGRTFVNHLSCTLTFLNQFARKYIDLVGQFENQKLLSGSYQLSLLDHFAGLSKQVDAYRDLYRNFKSLAAQKSQLEESRHQREQRLDYLNYQLTEIEKLSPSTTDEEELLRRKVRLMNLEKSQRLSQQLTDIFDGPDSAPGLHTLVKQLSLLILKNTDVCSDEEDIVSQLQEGLQKLETRLKSQLDQDIDPEELEGVLDRLDLYQKLKKKFGGSVENVLLAQSEFLKEKSTLEGLEFNLDEICQRLDKNHKELLNMASTLHQKRVTAAKKLEKELTSRLRSLRMNGATTRIEVEAGDDITETGISRLEFLAETNLGEGFFRIKEVASGGELSRILLSLRQILSHYESISIFLFDEIDTGIGGETGNCIGKALKDVSSQGQVIAITHLPQIAQYADILIMVQKETHQEKSETRTESSVREIAGKMILKEVKTMAQLQ